MKYLKKELLICECESSEQQEHLDETWKEQCYLLSQEQRKIRNKLPSKLWNILTDTGFHDAIIENIEISKKVKKYKPIFDVVITMRIGESIIELHHKDVLSFKSDLCFKNSTIHFDYLYGEFLFEDGKYIHNFLAFDYCETNIICKDLKIKISYV